MKAHIMTLQLIIAVAACKAAKFPILSKHDGKNLTYYCIPLITTQAYLQSNLDFF